MYLKSELNRIVGVVQVVQEEAFPAHVDRYLWFYGNAGVQRTSNELDLLPTVLSQLYFV